jgi:hypothetical protein
MLYLLPSSKEPATTKAPKHSRNYVPKIHFIVLSTYTSSKQPISTRFLGQCFISTQKCGQFTCVSSVHVPSHPFELSGAETQAYITHSKHSKNEIAT